ncbi:metal ABC transporter permease [Demequina pelophila]|uniref:metal ABC transporter permease n=1 Tax=Demequina pelophila TaxID=1638984 RepID=UPI00078375BD|nr:metal ABC transporter permease [Demequina pelophila]
MSAVEWLVDPWSYSFMVRALVITLAASCVGAMLSAWLVHIGWSLLGDAVSHAVLPGVVLAPLLGLPYAVGAIVFGLLAVALIQGVHEHSRIKEDAAIGVVFSTLFAAGLVLISVTTSEVDRSHILFGNMLGVSDADALQVFVLSAIALGVMLAFRHRFTWFAFDRAHMASLGRSPRATAAMILAVLALVAVAALQAVGVVLVVAMLITPGATAHLLTNSLARMLWLAPAIAAAVTVVGLYASYHLDTASGATVVTVHGLAFGLAFAFGRYGVLRRHLRRAVR